MNKQTSDRNMYSTSTLHKTVTVAGLSIFYREAGDSANPKMVLLHGFPASSHQYRDLIPALAEYFHVVPPDYPGFGNSDLPSPDEFSYTFDRLSEIMERFLKTLGFTHFGLYMQDYGGPIGFRIITRHPEWLECLVIQNANAYEIGFTSVGDSLIDAVSKNRTFETEEQLSGFLQLDAIKQVYLYGHKNPEVQTIGTWTLDSWNGQKHGVYRLICSMITLLM